MKLVSFAALATIWLVLCAKLTHGEAWGDASIKGKGETEPRVYAAPTQSRHTTRLRRRGFRPGSRADDAMWQKYVDKGNHLLCLMHAPDEAAGRLIGDTRQPPSASSTWTGDLFDQMKKWYWHQNMIGQEEEADFEEDLGSTFRGLGINARSRFWGDGDRDVDANADNIAYNVGHLSEGGHDEDDVYQPMVPVLQQKYIANGKEYTATGGIYKFVLNFKAGAIFGKDIMSPPNAVKLGFRWNRPAAPDELPEFGRLSDIYWAYWVKNNPNIKNLRFYSAHQLANEEINLLAPRAFHNKGIKMPTAWPGHTFATDTDEGKALLGSPIGATIAHLLIQHKAELGLKYVSKVTVVTNDFGATLVPDEEPTWHVFFYIEDVPPEEHSGGMADVKVVQPRGDPKFEIRVHRVEI